MCLCSRIIISVPLINNVTYRRLISIFNLASLNKLEPRCIGREDLWPALEFLILGIQGEFHANVNVQQIEQLEKRNLVVEAQLLKSLDPNNRKLLEASDRGDDVSWGRREAHIKQLKFYSLIKGHLLMLCASYQCFRKGGKLPRSV